MEAHQLWAHSCHAYAAGKCVLDGRWQLERYLVGVQGAFGFPFAGTDLQTGRPVFVKLLKPTTHDNYPARRELAAVREGGVSVSLGWPRWGTFPV